MRVMTPRAGRLITSHFRPPFVGASSLKAWVQRQRKVVGLPMLGHTPAAHDGFCTTLTKPPKVEP